MLAGSIELDEGFFSTQTPADKKEEPLKRDRGSQRKSKVLVMAESEYVADAKGKPRRMGYLKMKVIDDLSRQTINEAVQQLACGTTEIISDASTSYADLKDFVPIHTSAVIPADKIGEQLPWVHIAISNAKRVMLNSFHNIKPEFLQNYLDEFCYKFNRRYHQEALFNRLLVASVSYQNQFRYI